MDNIINNALDKFGNFILYDTPQIFGIPSLKTNENITKPAFKNAN